MSTNDTSRLEELSKENEDLYKGIEKFGTDPNFKREIVWKNVIGFLFLHITGLYGLTLILRFKIKLLTFLWYLLLVAATGEGITMGAHRYFSHRSFKATLFLQIILLFLQTMAGQNCMYVWVRDHRQHHKFSDTDADPHNANRGFFFSHMGWLMSRKHPLVIEKGKTVDMSDLDADPLIMFQKKYYILLYILIGIVLPVIIPIYLWNETIWNSLMISYFLRNITVLNQTWTVNSLAHLWGNKPFDKNIKPSENDFVSAITGGEGWHNYHHTFPWDYRTSEYGMKHTATTKCIEWAKSLGLAYDLKVASLNMIKQRSLRTGDGSHLAYKKTTNTNGVKEETNNQSHNSSCSEVH